MTFKPARLLLALIAAAALPAFAQNAAVVNGKPIPSSRVDKLVAQVTAQSQAQGQGQQRDPKELRALVLRELVAAEVMMQEAAKLGLDKSEAVKQQFEATRQEIVMQALMREFTKKTTVTDAEIQAEYDRYKALPAPTEYHVRHIQADSEADAKAAIAKLKGGAKFDDLAKASKDLASASQGGDLGWITLDSYPRPFGEAVAALKKGAVTENPVQLGRGWHVIKLDDSRTAQVQPLDKIKQQVGDAVMQRKQQAYVEQLTKKAVVK